jgi:hypothetical protein
MLSSSKPRSHSLYWPLVQSKPRDHRQAGRYHEGEHVVDRPNANIRAAPIELRASDESDRLCGRTGRWRDELG